MSLSRQLIVLVSVSVLLGLGARVVQKQTVPFWGFPEPVATIAIPPDVMAVESVSPDSAFAPSDQPYKIELPTVMGLYMKRKKNNVHFVDARETKLYGEGHIPGAVNIPFEHVAEQESIAIPKEDLVVIYCDGGDCHLSHDLAAYMIEGGWKRIAVYEGGWAEWSEETDFVSSEEKPEAGK